MSPLENVLVTYSLHWLLRFRRYLSLIPDKSQNFSIHTVEISDRLVSQFTDIFMSYSSTHTYEAIERTARHVILACVFSKKDLQWHELLLIIRTEIVIEVTLFKPSDAIFDNQMKTGQPNATMWLNMALPSIWMCSIQMNRLVSMESFCMYVCMQICKRFSCDSKVLMLAYPRKLRFADGYTQKKALWQRHFLFINWIILFRLYFRDKPKKSVIG